MRTKFEQEKGAMTKEFPHETVRRVRLGRLAAGLAAAGLGASLIAAGSAGAATGVVVSTTKNSHYGTILVSHTTLYTLKPSKTACGAGCLKIWPQVLLPAGATSATAGSGVNAANLGTVQLKNGALQVTYMGKPLYWFSQDKKPGQAKGNIRDKWGAWSVVVMGKAASSGSGSGSNANSGSGGSAGTGGVSF